MSPLVRRHRIPPPAYLAGTLLALIVGGALLLRLPAAQRGSRLGWVDAFFTTTSAACVTGLVVADTGQQFTPFGQAVLLLLIQLGGIGVMTIGTMVMIALGYRPPPAMRTMLRELATHRPAVRPLDVLRMVVAATALVEAAGAALLFVAFVRDHPPLRAAWLAIFHSVSAFCNAGFSLWGDSLSRYAADPLVNFTAMGLIVTGGLGFVVLVEMRAWVASRMRRAGVPEHLSLHAKIVLAGTAAGFALGFAAVLLFDRNTVLAGRPLAEKLLAAAFQSVTTRTAGFNTVDIGSLSNPTILVFIGLMFVGAGPGGTAGGIKITSAAAVLALVVQRLRNRSDVRLFGRSIGEASLQRAVVLAFLASLMIVLTIVGIEIAETRGAPDLQVRGQFLAVAFESVSAFGTVGLSMGITSALAPLSKAMLIVLMFVGRVGPLALMDFFQHLPPPPPVRYAAEELMIG